MGPAQKGLSEALKTQDDNISKALDQYNKDIQPLASGSGDPAALDVDKKPLPVRPAQIGKYYTGDDKGAEDKVQKYQKQDVYKSSYFAASDRTQDKDVQTMVKNINQELQDAQQGLSDVKDGSRMRISIQISSRVSSRAMRRRSIRNTIRVLKMSGMPFQAKPASFQRR